MFLIFIFSNLIISTRFLFNNAQSSNIVFDLADLTVDYETDSGWVTLEAFKSSSNDAIIQKKDKDNYGQLNWLSIGFPRLLCSIRNSKELFTFRPEGFYTRVEMLTAEHRKLFQNLVRRKYNINITSDQIVTLIPSRFECQLKFYKDSQIVLLNGFVNQINKFPLKLEFEALKNSKERILFEDRINEDGTDLDLEFNCQVSSTGQLYRQNTLIITGQQLNQLRIIDDIFGPASEVFVTRKQISKLSSDLYYKLNIIEEYQMPETQFSNNFVDDFIQQTSSIILKYVKIDEALNDLSQYDFHQDIKPNIIKQELSKVFVVNSTGSKSHIVLDNDFYEYLKTTLNTNTQASISTNVLDLFGASASGSFVLDKSGEWNLKNKSLNDQLNELNSYFSNHVEWERNGEIIVPKSIKVSRLSKASFSKNLVFSRVKREYYDAAYTRKVTLNTFNSFYSPEIIEENARRLEKLESQIKQLDIRTGEIDKNLKQEFPKLETNLNAINDSIQTIFSSTHSYFNTKYQALTNAVDEVNSKIMNQYKDLKSQISLRALGCRICFRETEGSSQCQGSRNTCSDLASLSNQGPSWTSGFRDDTDNRGGGCNYSWVVYCNYA